MCLCILNISAVLMLNLQQPVDSHQEADILSWKPDRREDQEHCHKSSTGDAGSSNTGQRGCHTAGRTRSLSRSTKYTPQGFNHDKGVILATSNQSE